MAIFKLHKMEFGPKIFMKLIYLISRGFFLVWTFFNFLAHCVSVKLCWKMSNFFRITMYYLRILFSFLQTSKTRANHNVHLSTCKQSTVTCRPGYMCDTCNFIAGTAVHLRNHLVSIVCHFLFPLVLLLHTLLLNLIFFLGNS